VTKRISFAPRSLTRSIAAVAVLPGRQHRRHDEVTAGMAVECARADEVITDCAG